MTINGYVYWYNFTAVDNIPDIGQLQHKSGPVMYIVAYYASNVSKAHYSKQPKTRPRRKNSAVPL